MMSIMICPADRLNAEPDLLSLFGHTISLKIKSPKSWTECVCVGGGGGGLVAFMFIPNL